MLPSLSALRAFDAAARLGSFRAAAEALSVSATAISHHIRGLEEVLQASLFDRVGRNVTLTEDGKRLAQATTTAFGLLQEAVDSFQAKPQRSVRLAVGPIMTARWLMPRISDFWSAHPGIDLEVLPTYMPQQLARGDADIVIRWTRLTEVPRGTPVLLELQPVAVASPEFIARQGPFNAPEDVLRSPILHQRDHWGWRDWLMAMGVEPPETLRGPIFEDANVLIRGAIEGQGAILGWLPLVEADLAEGRIARLFGEDITPTHGYVVEMLDHGRTARRSVQVVHDWLLSAAQ